MTLNSIIANFQTFKLADLLDIIIIAFLIYQLLGIINRTRAGQLAKGALLVLAVYLVANVLNMRSIYPADKADKLSERNIKLIEEIAERTQSIENGVDELIAARKVANKIENEHDKAIAYHDTVAPKMEEIRYQIDKLELIVEDDLWTLPKYRELLFIR